jgi:hypothetical protein
MEIVMVGLGAPGEKGCTALGLLNTVFSKGLDLDERRRRVEEDYKIKVGQSFYEDMEAMTMNLDEELEAYYKKQGVEESDHYWINAYLDVLYSKMKNESLSFDEVLEISGIDEDHRQFLIEENAKRISH